MGRTSGTLIFFTAILLFFLMAMAPGMAAASSISDTRITLSPSVAEANAGDAIEVTVHIIPGNDPYCAIRLGNASSAVCKELEIGDAFTAKYRHTDTDETETLSITSSKPFVSTYLLLATPEAEGDFTLTFVNREGSEEGSIRLTAGAGTADYLGNTSAFRRALNSTTASELSWKKVQNPSTLEVTAHNGDSTDYPETLTARVTATTWQGNQDKRFYLAIDPDRAALSGELTDVTAIDAQGNPVALHADADGVWFELSSEQDNSVTFDLPFASMEEDERIDFHSESAALTGSVAETVAEAKTAAGAKETPDVTLRFLSEPVDNVLRVTTDLNHGYFDATLTAHISAQTGRGKDNVFFIRTDAEKALTKLLEGKSVGDVVYPLDGDGQRIRDEQGNELALHVAEDGFWFEMI